MGVPLLTFSFASENKSDARRTSGARRGRCQFGQIGRKRGLVASAQGRDRELDRLPRDVPLLLEHLEGEEYATARDAVFAVGDEIGVAFHGRSRD